MYLSLYQGLGRHNPNLASKALFSSPKSLFILVGKHHTPVAKSKRVIQSKTSAMSIQSLKLG